MGGGSRPGKGRESGQQTRVQRLASQRQDQALRATAPRSGLAGGVSTGVGVLEPGSRWMSLVRPDILLRGL